MRKLAHSAAPPLPDKAKGFAGVPTGAVSEADWGRENLTEHLKHKQNCELFSPSVTAFAVPPPSSEGGGFLLLTPAFSGSVLTFLTVCGRYIWRPYCRFICLKKSSTAAAVRTAA